MVLDALWSVGGPFDRPALVGAQHTELWLLDGDGRRVTIQLVWHPDTDPALVAEAHAVIDSIVIELSASGYRLVFYLEDGWSSG